MIEEPQPGDAVVKTLLVTDLVESTALLEKLGDAKGFDVATRHDRVARDLLVCFRGREIDKTDGFLFLFDHPADAVAYALAYHRALAELSVQLKVQLRARAGIHLGEVMLRENSREDVARGAKPLEVEGLAKPTAARTMSLAKANQTLLTRSAFDQARGEPLADLAHESRLRWLAHGPYHFKGVQDPIEIFEVGAEGFAPLAVPPDTVKAKRAVHAADEHVLGWRPAPGQEVARRPHWILRAKLGEGGFGEVWLAVHRQTEEKRVFKFCFDADRLRGLQREVTLFRLLKETLGNRADIARILDWEFDEAPYFLEAEYTEGGNLAEWALERGGIATVPISTRLELMAEVAEALSAAHSVGVLHKDVKPTNVLVQTVAGAPRIRLTDFGIGTVLDSAALLARGITLAGITQVRPDSDYSWSAGTQMYMAPELQEGKPATVQADIYALGVMLYQVVVADLTRALGVGWERDVDDELLREDIAACVDGSPRRRLASAQELADRLRHVDERRAKRTAERLEREKVEADRVALEQAQRRKKRWAWASSLAAAVTLVVSYFAYDAMTARREADSRRNQAEDLIGFMIKDLRPKLEEVGRLDLLDGVHSKALAYLAAVPEEMLSDRELFRHAQVLQQIGQAQIERGNLPGATEVLNQALSLADELITRDPDNTEWIFDLSQIHFWMGFVSWRQRDFTTSLEHLTQYRDLSRRLVDLNPAREDWLSELGHSHHNMGALLRESGDLRQALEEFLRGLAIKEQLLRNHPSDPQRKRDVATTHNHLGLTLARLGDPQAALAHYRTDVALTEQLIASHPENVDYRFRNAASLNRMASTLADLGEREAALENFLRALSIMQSLVARDRENIRWQRELGINHTRVAQTLLAQGHVEQAGGHVARSLDILTTVSRHDPSNPHWQLDVARALVVDAVLRGKVGDRSLAVASALRARNITNTLLAKDQHFDEARRTAVEAGLQAGIAQLVAGQSEEGLASLHDALDLAATDSTVGSGIMASWLQCARRLADGALEGIDLARNLLALGPGANELSRLCALEAASGVALDKRTSH